MKAELAISLKNIKHNYLYLKSLTGEKNFAVVKTNAYGLGVERISTYLSEFVDGFAVATLDEAMALKNNNIRNDILIMIGCFSADEFRVAIENNFIIAVTTKEQVQNLLDFKCNKDIRIFLKFDSGMSRLGLDEKQFIEFYQIFKKKKNIDITIMSHFCCSDNKEISQIQINKFNVLQKKLNIKKTSFSNSDAIINQLITQTYSRIGISLYGIGDENLAPVVSLKAPIIAIKTIEKGEFIGYGQNFKCQKNIKIAVVKLGYGDGYPRNINENTQVFINDKKSVILGMVSMDMITISLDGIDANIFDKVEFFGENISVQEVAKSADTIVYEIFCNLSTRMTKIYRV